MPNKPALAIWLKSLGSSQCYIEVCLQISNYCRRSGNPHDDASECSVSGDEDERVEEFLVQSGKGEGM